MTSPTHGSNILHAALNDVARFGRLPDDRRRQIESEVDALIAFLDTADGDPDREPEEDRGDLDHLPDDDAMHPLDATVLPVTPLSRTGVRP